MTTRYTSIELTEMSCGQCGVVFAMPAAMQEEKERDGGGWYCPNGHSRVYKEPEVKRLEREKKALATQLTQAKDQLAAAEREKKRIEKRIVNGVCPCCNRTFQNVQRHMKTKHPSYVD